MSGSNKEREGDNKIVANKLASDLLPTREKTSKWMSSKMRLMRKMMSTTSCPHEKCWQTSTKDSCSSSTSTPSGLPARVCSNCKTTKTPLWRSGPQGPKSLCNACGIRQMKARKAMAAAAAAAASSSSSVTSGSCGKEKVYDSCNAVIPHKKRFKLEESSRKIKLEDHNINLKNNSGLHPQDEKEAAILLMALSCDLIYC